MPSLRRISLALLVTVAVLASVVAAGPRVAGPVGELYDRVEVLGSMLQIIQRNYVEDVDADTLFENAVSGVLDELDPHSRYYTAEEYDELTERYRGDYYGIGIQFDILNGYITVLDAIEGGPSEALGLRPGDQIVAIEGEDAQGIDIDTTYEKLRGPKGTQVAVTVRRPGQDELRELTITRDQVEIAAIRATAMLDEETGYIWLQTFSQKTASQLDEALKDLESRGMKHLVLDLRGNTGGLMNQAIRVADKFLGGDKEIVITKGRTPNANGESMSTDRDTHPRFPMTVLVDHRSASASEIVAGALQDWDRALIAGQRTFGKALVQNQYPFKDGSALFLTIARYYTPSGRLIQRDYEDREAYTHPDWEQIASSTAPPGRSAEDGEPVTDSEETGADEPEAPVDADGDAPDAPAAEEQADAPTYRTASGRIVHGGGGIAPDVKVEPSTVARLALYLFNRRLSFQFAMDYASRNAATIPPSFEAYQEEYRVPQEAVDEFYAFLDRPSVRSILEDDGVELTDEMLAEAREDVRVYLKSGIAANIWGQEQAWLVLVDHDEQVREAIQLKQRAVDLLEREGSLAG